MRLQIPLMLVLMAALVTAIAYDTPSWTRDWSSATAGSELSVSVPNIKVPVTWVGFTVDKQVTDASLTMEIPEKTKDAPYNVIQYIDFIPVNLDSVSKISARFRVDKTLIGDAEVKLYSAKDWSKVELTQTSIDNKYSYYVAVLPAFGLYGFAVPSKAKEVIEAKEEVVEEPAKEIIKEHEEVPTVNSAVPTINDDAIQQTPQSSQQDNVAEQSPVMKFLLHPISLVIGGLLLLVILVNIIFHFTHKDEDKPELEEHSDEHVMKLKPLHERQSIERQKWPYIDKRKGERRKREDKYPLQNLVEDVENEKK